LTLIATFALNHHKIKLTRKELDMTTSMANMNRK